MNYTQLIVNLASVERPRKGSRSFFIKECRHFFTIINVFAKFLILSDILLFEYFRLEGKIIELDFANKFNSVTL